MLFLFAGGVWQQAGHVVEVRFVREDAHGLFIQICGHRIPAKIVAPD
jgi:hypothetical protein